MVLVRRLVDRFDYRMGSGPYGIQGSLADQFFFIMVRFHIDLAGMRLYANDMLMSFLSRIRRLEKVAIDFCPLVRQIKFDLVFGAKFEKSNSKIKSRIRILGPSKRLGRPQHRYLGAFARSRLFRYANELTPISSFA